MLSRCRSVLLYYIPFRRIVSLYRSSIRPRFYWPPQSSLLQAARTALNSVQNFHVFLNCSVTFSFASLATSDYPMYLPFANSLPRKFLLPWSFVCQKSTLIGFNSKLSIYWSQRPLPPSVTLSPSSFRPFFFSKWPPRVRRQSLCSTSLIAHSPIGGECIPV